MDCGLRALAILGQETELEKFAGTKGMPGQVARAAAARVG
jgi:hypothetical protein